MSSTDSASTNLAVLQCLQAFKLRYDAERAKGTDTYSSAQAAAAEYRRAMPHLHGRKSIQDFIACVGHGMLVGAIPNNHGPQFLYAAQIALNSLPPEPRPLSRPPGRPPGASEPTPAEPSAPATELTQC